MANPNLVRKPSDSPTGGAGEVTPAQIIDAGPNDQNYIINGAFDFWQRATSSVASSEVNGPTDRWAFGRTGGGGTLIMSRSTDVPSNAKSTYSASLTVNLAAPSLGATDRYGMFQKIEGSIIAPLYNEKVTLSFWVKSSVTGTYSIWFGNGAAANGFYVSSYSISSANTWEQKSITVDLSAKVGSWSTDNTIGMYVYFALAAGSSTTSATPNVWSSNSTALAVAGQTNFMATSGSTFLISQVILNRGTSPSPFLRHGRNYVGEMQACQRYYAKSYNLDVFVNASTWLGATTGHPMAPGSNDASSSGRLPVRMRANPSITAYSPNGGQNVVGRSNGQNLSLSSIQSGELGFFAYWNNQGQADDAFEGFHWTADAEL